MWVASETASVHPSGTDRPRMPRPPAAPSPAAAEQPSAKGSLAERFEREALPQMKALYSTAYHLTRNAADAEDLVQETCLRALRAFQGYAADTNIRAWLFTIFYRVRADHFRKTARSPQTVELLDEGPAVAPPQDVLATGHEDVARALHRLPEVFRTALVLRDVQDFSYDEIARITKVPIGTVMSRIHRGRSLMRRALVGLRPA